MSLVWRILATLAATNLVVLFVFVGIATLQFEAILGTLVTERLEVIAKRTRVPFASVAELGLPVSSVRNAPAVLEAAKQTDPAIRSVKIFGSDGSTIHSTDATDARVVPTSWLQAREEAAVGDAFHLFTGTNFIVGLDVVETGASSASVAITYSRAEERNQVRAMAAKLSFMAGTIMAVSLLLGFFVVRVSISEHLRTFDGILACYGSFERSFWRRKHLKSEMPDPVDGLGVSTVAFWDLLWKSERSYEVQRDDAAAKQDRGIT